MTSVSSNHFVQQSIDAINQRQRDIAQLQQQVSSGQRILRPSDDPIAAAQAEMARSDIERVSTERRMVEFAQFRLQLAEGAIGSGVDAMTNARDVLLAANNDTYGADERAIFAAQIRSARDELLTIANRSDSLGAYVFGGAGARQPPFEDSPTGVQFTADAGEQLTGDQYQYLTSIDGRALFGGGIGPGGTRESAFDTLDRVATLLEDPAVDPIDLHDGVKLAIDSLDQITDQFSTVRARLGEQLASAGRVLNILNDSELGSQARLSELADTDFAQALSDLSRHQTHLQAAMQTYAQISGLSLFNYIR